MTHTPSHQRTIKRFLLLAAALPLLAVGCSTTRTRIAQTLASSAPPPVARDQSLAKAYRIACPDHVSIAIDSMPEVSGVYVVSPEGRIALPSLGNPRVEGHTSSSLADCIASEFGVTAELVKCEVKAHHSRVIFVHGPIAGGDRAVEYRGPENVITFIRRCGGLKPGADFKDIHIVRPNVANGSKPKVIVVNLEAILLQGNPHSNVLLQPFDEICIGEMARSKVGKALPHWLNPLYRVLCGLFPWGCAHDWRRE